MNWKKKKHFDNLKQIFKNHDNKPFYVFRYISFVKNFLLLSKSGMYTIQVPSRREHIFLDRLQKACYIQVKKRRVVKEPINSDSMMKFFLRLMFFLDDFYFCKYNSYYF